MKKQSSYNTWNFTPVTGIWAIDEGVTYPRLQSFPLAIMSTLTINVRGSLGSAGGTVTCNPPLPGNGKYAQGTVVTLTAVPDKSTHASNDFVYWTSDSGVADKKLATTTITMDGNKTVTVHFGRHYDVTNITELQAMRTDRNGVYNIKNTIDASATSVGAGFIPVGEYGTNQEFYGELCGGNHVIRNLSINRQGSLYQGLFGILGADSTVSGVGLENCKMTTGHQGGALVSLNKGTVQECYVTGSVTSTGVTGAIAGPAYTNESGGFVGENRGAIKNCYAVMDVIGAAASGFCNANFGEIRNCYSAGIMHGSYLYGFSLPNLSPFVNSYYDNSIAPNSNSYPIETNGRTTLQMKTQETFVGWDFDDIWKIEPDVTYPRLRGFADTNNDKCTLSITANANCPVVASPLPDANGKYAAGTMVTLTAQPADGYRLKRWRTAASDAQRLALSITLEMTTNKSISADSYKYYEVKTLTDLQNVNNDLDGYYEQKNDIDASSTNVDVGFLPIGTGSQFTGTYDGKLFFITDLHINRPTATQAGLFAHLNNEAQVRGVQLQGGSVLGDGLGSGSDAAGVGGLAGINILSTVFQCYADVTVTAKGNVGGLIGLNWCPVSNCYAHGDVTATALTPGRAGGFIGYAMEPMITNCYSKGEVVGPVTDPVSVGGFIGFFRPVSTSCYWDLETSEQSESKGGDGTTGMHTADMMTKTNFVGWDFDNVWDIRDITVNPGNPSYPFFKKKRDTGLRITIEPAEVVAAGAKWWANGVEYASGDWIDEPGTYVVSFNYVNKWEAKPAPRTYTFADGGIIDETVEYKPNITNNPTEKPIVPDINGNAQVWFATGVKEDKEFELGVTFRKVENPGSNLTAERVFISSPQDSPSGFVPCDEFKRPGRMFDAVIRLSYDTTDPAWSADIVWDADPDCMPAGLLPKDVRAFRVDGTTNKIIDIFKPDFEPTEYVFTIRDIHGFSDWYLGALDAVDPACVTVYTKANGVLHEPDGAGWRLYEGAPEPEQAATPVGWNPSGYKMCNIPLGDYSAHFNSVPFYVTPWDVLVRVVDSSDLEVTGVYVPFEANVTMSFTNLPPDVPGMEWRYKLKSAPATEWSAWLPTGAQVSLPLDVYEFNFNDAADWITPVDQEKDLHDGRDPFDPAKHQIGLTAAYVHETTDLEVTMHGRVQNLGTARALPGAQWALFELDGVTPASGWYPVPASTLTDEMTPVTVYTGNYLLRFRATTDTKNYWIVPADVPVSLVVGTTETVDVTYYLKTGLLQGIALPAEAIADGAKWIYEGVEYASGVSIEVPCGEHVVTFHAIVGWTTPVGQTAEVVPGTTSTVTGVYTKLPTYLGALQGFIAPDEVQALGGRWVVDGVQYDDNYVMENLTQGSYFVTFTEVAGWTTPVGQMVTVVSGATTQVTGAYTQIGAGVGSLQVFIDPLEVRADAKWVLNGVEYAHEAVVSNLAVGAYVVTFTDVAGWTKPAYATLLVVANDTTQYTGIYTQIPPPELGSVQGFILPAGLVGAKWVLGGIEYDSTNIASDLPVGEYTVTFKPVAGWYTPTSQTVTVVANVTTPFTGIYTNIIGGALGALEGLILPQEAIADGAKWILAGAEYDSGTILTELAAGAYTVSFKPVAGWVTPAAQTVTVVANATVTATGTYTQLTAGMGALQGFTVPDGLVGATWWVNGSEYASGVVVANLMPGPYTVSFSLVAGWNTPSDVTVTVFENETAQATGAYTQTGAGNGSLQVFISPTAAADIAQWTFDGINYHDSGDIVANLPAGAYIVSFTDIGADWTTPASATLMVTANATTQYTGTYTHVGGGNGFLQGFLLPAEAIGAKWILNGSEYDDADTENLAEGLYTVTFKNIAGWFTPPAQTVTVVAGATTQFTGVYTPVGTGATGSLQGIIMPQEAIDAGARWILDSVQYDTQAVVTGLLPGTYTVTFKPVAGWVTPAAQTVTVVAGATATATGTYTQLLALTGALQGFIAPQGAIDAGAKWIFGTVNNSGDIITNLAPLMYTVTFTPVAGWNTPADVMVTVIAGATVQVTGAYTQIGAGYGQLQVFIDPAGAITDGATWSINGMAGIHESGDIVSNLPAGAYIVKFTDVSGWTSPAEATLTVTANNKTQYTGLYAQYGAGLGTLQGFTLPAEAVGAKWIVNGTEYASGFELENLPVGLYTVSFKPVVGWVTPPSQTVGVTDGALTVVTGTYTTVISGVTGSLEGIILPAEAIVDGAKWILDSVEYDSGVILNELAPGTYTVSFKPVAGWITPHPVTVTVVAGATATATGTYVQLPPYTGQLQVFTEPAGARANGAAWFLNGVEYAHGATVAELYPGEYTVYFKAVLGWNTPASQVVTVTVGNLTQATGVYTRKTTCLTVFPSVIGGTRNGDNSTTRWQIMALDVGAGDNTILTWNLPGSVCNIPYGDYLITFRSISGYYTPRDIPLTIDRDGIIVDEAHFGAAACYFFGKGAIVVNCPGPLEGSWTLYDSTGTNVIQDTRINRPAAGLFAGDWVVVNSGNYLVKFGDVANWDKPANTAVALTQIDAMKTLTLPYVAHIGKISVVVGAPPVGGAFRIAGMDGTFALSDALNLNVGDYTVTFTDVAGYVTPAAQTVKVTKNATTTLNAEYVKATATMSLDDEDGVILTAAESSWNSGDNRIQLNAESGSVKITRKVVPESEVEAQFPREKTLGPGLLREKLVVVHIVAPSEADAWTLSFELEALTAVPDGLDTYYIDGNAATGQVFAWSSGYSATLDSPLGDVFFGNDAKVPVTLSTFELE